MQRNFVKVARVRIEDIQVGDVVNRDPDAETGWFEVDCITVLFNDDLQLADRTELLTLSGPFFTIVGVQFVTAAEVPQQPPSPLPVIEVVEEAVEEAPAPQPAVLETPAALVGGPVS